MAELYDIEFDEDLDVETVGLLALELGRVPLPGPRSSPTGFAAGRGRPGSSWAGAYRHRLVSRIPAPRRMGSPMSDGREFRSGFVFSSAGPTPASPP